MSRPPREGRKRVRLAWRWLAGGLGCGAVLGAIWCGAQEIPVQTHRFTNGLNMLVNEDASIPSVALYLFYRVGSRNERPGATGLSHFFEHMMFNGARKYGPKEFDRVMEAAGGRNNAYTSCDLTVYQDWFPPTALELILDLESDRIAHLSFDPKMIESERGVVISERRTSIEASTSGALEELLRATAFVAHPYHWPVIGWMPDIEHWQLADLKHHFDMGYSPANATLVVCGAVRFAEMTALVRRYLEPIPARAPPPPVVTREPEQTGERRVVLNRFAQLPLLMMAYHVPESRHPDYAALRVLEQVLFFGQSARLYRRLVDKEQLALSIEGGLTPALDPTLFQMTIQPREGVNLPRLEAVLEEELARLRREDLPARELQKAKNILLAEHYRRLKTIDGKAQALGEYELFFGDYRQLFQAPGQYAAVTAADVKRVAEAYFTARNRTVATLAPEKEPAGRRVP